MKKKRTYIANWKMNFSYNEACEFSNTHKEQLITLANQEKNDVILCPSFDALSFYAKTYAQTAVGIGAQTISQNKTGNHTGQVQATSIAQLGCTHGIVGHSERRACSGETNEAVGEQAKQLLENDIAPIYCIGETLEQYEQGATLDVLEQQLAPLLNLSFTTKQTMYIAYEPVWSIGTGKLATPETLRSVYSTLSKKIASLQKTNSLKLLYGGSVKSTNLDTFDSIVQIDGFLIGGASLDFQELEKIINYQS